MSYDRQSPARARRRGALGYWIPLAVTVTVAAIGIGAWIWSERRDDDDEGDDATYDRPPEHDGSIRTAPPEYGTGELRTGEAGYGTTQSQTQSQTQEESSSYMARMSGALRRTPSPHQLFDSAGRAVVAGVGAAGAVVGSALASIREEDKEAFRDHEAWSEEERLRQVAGGASSTREKPQGRRKTVAVVVSADTNMGGLDDSDDILHEHASILSHLPRHINFSTTRLFILIYAPNLPSHPLSSSTDSARAPGSLSSSFSNIGYDQTYTPTLEASGSASAPAEASTELPLPSSSDSPSPSFSALYSEAQLITEKETMILPFTTPTGYTHMLRHLSPEIVYLQESLAGTDGSTLRSLQTWLRHDVVLVVGAESGHGGLADSSESEAEHVQKEKGEMWWEKEDRVGLGRGVVVVEGLRIGDDWTRRVEGRE